MVSRQASSSNKTAGYVACSRGHIVPIVAGGRCSRRSNIARCPPRHLQGGSHWVERGRRGTGSMVHCTVYKKFMLSILLLKNLYQLPTHFTVFFSMLL